MNTGPRLASHSVNAHTVLCIHGEQLTRALERTAHLWVWAVTVHSQTNTLPLLLRPGALGHRDWSLFSQSVLAWGIPVRSINLCQLLQPLKQKELLPV